MSRFRKVGFVVALFFSPCAFAESSMLKVLPFSGELSVVVSGVKIKKVELEVRNQFCNFWGTTCAGGPSDSEIVSLNLRADSDRYSFSLVKPVSIHSSYLVNSFSSCNVTLIAQGENESGAAHGEYSLIWVNDRDVCNSAVALHKLIEEQLTAPLIVSSGGFGGLKITR